MKYCSTRNKKLDFNFKQIFQRSLAPEGGLFVPKKIKRFSLKTGHKVYGQIRPPKSKERFYALLNVEMVNDQPIEKL